MDYATFSSMDTKTLILTILIDVLITATAYLLVPLVLGIFKVKFFPSTIKTIVFLNGGVVFIVFAIIKNQLGIVDEEINFFPVLLWSSIAYFIMKKRCSTTISEEDYFKDYHDDADDDETVEEIVENNSTPTPDEKLRYSLSWDNEQPTKQLGLTYGDDICINLPTNKPLIEQEYRKKTENIEQTNKEKPIKKALKLKLFPVLLIAIIVLLVLLNIIQYISSLKSNNKTAELTREKDRLIAHCNTIVDENMQLSEEIEELEEDKEDLEDDKKELRRKYNAAYEKNKFYDKNIVFVLEGYGNYYFTYDEVLEVIGGDEVSYWAYNREQAINKGYHAYRK